jgi:hypothetical protein
MLAVVVGGCALATTGGEPDPEVKLRLGLNALAEQDLLSAKEHLEWVYRNHPSEPIGAQALVALIAGELDPRNPTRDLSATADLSSQLLHAADAPAWTRPLGQTLHLVAIELQDNGERIARVEAALDAAGLPEVNGASLPAQIEAANEERDRLQHQVDSLQVQTAQLKKDLDESRAELERIKKTVKG